LNPLYHCGTINTSTKPGGIVASELNPKEEDWQQLGTEKEDPVDLTEQDDYVEPDSLEDGPPEDYPDEDGVID